jgi:hypothetical protein
MLVVTPRVKIAAIAATTNILTTLGLIIVSNNI